MLFSSSATVYGVADTLPVTEQTPRQPATSPYGNTKQICEDILRDCVQAYDGVKGIALRYFNPIGAHPSALIGELPRGVPNNLVPFITQTAIGRREVPFCLRQRLRHPRRHLPARLHRHSGPRQGPCLRGLQNARRQDEAGLRGLQRRHRPPVSVLELINSFERVNQLKLNWKFAPRRSGDVPAIWADTTLANRELGWKAERSVDETLAAAWAWEKHLAEER